MELLSELLFNWGVTLGTLFIIFFIFASIVVYGRSQRPNIVIKRYFAEFGYNDIEIKNSSLYSFQDKKLLKDLDKRRSELDTFNPFICFKVELENQETIHILYQYTKLPFVKSKFFLDKKIKNNI